MTTDAGAPSVKHETRGGHPWLIALAILAVAIVLLVVFWDWNWFKRPVEHYVQSKTGRHLVIGGNLAVHLGRTTTVQADRVAFGNAPWAKTPDMARADRVAFDIHLWPLLLHREAQIPSITLTRPDVLLETGPNHVGNWVLPSTGGKGAQFNDVWIDHGHLKVVDASARTGLDVDINSRHGSDNKTPTIDVGGKGLWKGSEFTVQGIADSPLDLRQTNRPYRIDMHLAAGTTRAHVRGRLLNPFHLQDFDLQLAMAGRNLGDLYPLLGLAMPPTPAYQLDGALSHIGAVWTYDHVSGTVGSSDLAGSIKVDTGTQPTEFTANLRSRHMDIADMGGFLGATPGSKAKGTAAPSAAAHAPPPGKLLPDAPYNVAKLRVMDADVRLKVEHFVSTAVPLDDMDAHLLIESGVLRLDPLDFGVADGTIRSNIRMDAHQQALSTTARIQARGLNLSKLIPSAKFAKMTAGRIGGDFDLKGSGNSIAAILGSANGNAGVGMGAGAVSKLLMKLSGLDIGGAAKVMMQGDQQIPIRCGLGDFAVHDGVMSTQNLVFDTSDNTIVGQGNVSLKDETLDLQLRSKSKKFSLVSLRGPIDLTGTFRKPNVRPDYKQAGLRAAAALALGAVAAPVAALVATVQRGHQREIQCGRYGGS